VEAYVLFQASFRSDTRTMMVLVYAVTGPHTVKGGGRDPILDGGVLDNLQLFKTNPN
jgi:hypothetical protein